MVEEKKEDLNYQFVSLVFSLQQAAMAQLGKIANPATGKMEKNLVQAKATIDILEMLKEKSKDNLTETEQKIMLNTLDNLYLNYADEVEKPATTEATEKPATTEATEKPATTEGTEKKPATTEATEKETTEGTEKSTEGTEKEKPATTEGTEKEKPAVAEAQKETTEGAEKPTEEKKPKEEKKE